MNLIYRSPIDYRSKVITNCGDGGDAFVPLTTLRECILRNENLPYDIALSIYHNGKALSSENRLPHLDGVEDIFLQVSLPLVGGKGGFGSMLRAIGAQIEKTTNREACRDLSGRRLRDVNEEKRIKDYIKRQAARKAEEEKKRKEKLKRLAEATVPATCQFDDREFEQTRAEIPDIVEDSIIVGLKQQQQQSKNQSKVSTSNAKRKMDQIEDEEASKPDDTNVNEPKAETSSNNKRINSSPPEDKMLNKQALWLGVDLDSDSEDSSDDDEQVANSNAK